MPLKALLAVAVIVAMQLIQGGGIPITIGRTGKWAVIVHNATRKVVASDGTLWDFGKGEVWKQWLFYTIRPHEYILKTGLDGYPEYFPLAPKLSEGIPYSYVLGTSNEKECSASNVDKVIYYGKNSQIWRIHDGVTPIYNTCGAFRQLAVKQDGKFARVYTTVLSGYNKENENTLFEVTTTSEFKKEMRAKKKR